MHIKNIFTDIAASATEEITELISSSEKIRIERIISTGQASPEGFWYDQEENEFVMLLSGSAGIKFEDESVTHLSPGDYFVIPAHRKHRVQYTSEKEASIWLAVFY